MDCATYYNDREKRRQNYGYDGLEPEMEREEERQREAIKKGRKNEPLL